MTELICPTCDKVYKREHFYIAHIEKCKNEAKKNEAKLQQNQDILDEIKEQSSFFQHKALNQETNLNFNKMLRDSVELNKINDLVEELHHENAKLKKINQKEIEAINYLENQNDLIHGEIKKITDSIRQLRLDKGKLEENTQTQEEEIKYLRNQNDSLVSEISKIKALLNELNVEDHKIYISEAEIASNNKLKSPTTILNKSEKKVQEVDSYSKSCRNVT